MVSDIFFSIFRWLNYYFNFFEKGFKGSRIPGFKCLFSRDWFLPFQPCKYLTHKTYKQIIRTLIAFRFLDCRLIAALDFWRIPISHPPTLQPLNPWTLVFAVSPRKHPGWPHAALCCSHSMPDRPPARLSGVCCWFR